MTLTHQLDAEQSALHVGELLENAENSGLIGGRHGQLGDSTRIRARAIVRQDKSYLSCAVK